MVTGVASWLAPHCEEYRIAALDVALFFELPNAGNSRILTVVDVATGEG